MIKYQWKGLCRVRKCDENEFKLYLICCTFSMYLEISAQLPFQNTLKPNDGFAYAHT